MLPLRTLSKLRLLPTVAKKVTQSSISLASLSSQLIQANKINLAPPTYLISRSFSDAPKLDKALQDRLKKLTTKSRVVVLMKGDPKSPRCGFSNAVCRILEAHGVLEKKDPKTGDLVFSSFDILSDDSIREAAKVFSDWPTFPQVYFDGEFVGGCDVLMDMHHSGELLKALEKLGIESSLKSSS